MFNRSLTRHCADLLLECVLEAYKKYETSGLGLQIKEEVVKWLATWPLWLVLPSRDNIDNDFLDDLLHWLNSDSAQWQTLSTLFGKINRRTLLQMPSAGFS